VNIKLGVLHHPEVVALLQEHLHNMYENSPKGSVHALDLEALTTPDISFWTLWDTGTPAEDPESLLGCGALKELSPTTAEIKSMRTHSDHLRKGVAGIILQHIINVSKSRGYHTLSLETGSGPVFEPALKLYRKHGFQNGPAFADYQATQFNQFLHLTL
jgi:putative acetyltransferase